MYYKNKFCYRNKQLEFEANNSIGSLNEQIDYFEEKGKQQSNILHELQTKLSDQNDK